VWYKSEGFGDIMEPDISSGQNQGQFGIHLELIIKEKKKIPM